MTAADRQRKIAALRALAERPGTPAEGETARKMLERMESALPQQESGERYVDEKFEFVMNFDASLFQQAIRDAAAVIAKMAAEQAREGRSGVYESLFRDQEDWHSQQRREADERQRQDDVRRRQQRYADECQQQAERESTSFTCGAADIFTEMRRTGETIGQVFNRKKAEWAAQQKAGKK